MGNECCKVKSYIDEEEEYRNPFEILNSRLSSETIIPIETEKNIKTDLILHKYTDLNNIKTIPQENDELIFVDNYKQTTIDKCIINNDINPMDEDDKQNVLQVDETDSLDIISISSIQSFD